MGANTNAANVAAYQSTQEDPLDVMDGDALALGSEAGPIVVSQESGGKEGLSKV